MQKEPQLKGTTMGLMVASALLFDAVQALLTPFFMGWLVGIVAFLTFFIWFRLNGVKFTGTKRIAMMGIGGIVEVIPVVSALPVWTFAVLILIADVKAKSALGSVVGHIEPKTENGEESRKAA